MNLDHLDDLLDAYLFGELSQEQATQLREALQADPAARSRFVRSIFIETGLLFPLLPGESLLFTGGLLGLGILYDFWTLNRQVSEINRLDLSWQHGKP